MNHNDTLNPAPPELGWEVLRFRLSCFRWLAFTNCNQYQTKYFWGIKFFSVVWAFLQYFYCVSPYVFVISPIFVFVSAFIETDLQIMLLYPQAQNISHRICTLFVVLCSVWVCSLGMHFTNEPMFFMVASLTLKRSYHCSNVSEVTQKDTGKVYRYTASHDKERQIESWDALCIQT